MTNDDDTPGRARGNGMPGTLPAAGDSIAPVAISTGLAALAAAVLAYERRRSENEANEDES